MISEKFNNLKVTKSPGPDNIHAHILYELRYNTTNTPSKNGNRNPHFSNRRDTEKRCNNVIIYQVPGSTGDSPADCIKNDTRL